MSMATHVTATVKACFAALRQIRSVRRSLSRDALLTLIRALIVSKLDYCCSVLAGVSGTLQRRLTRLQSVFNAAAWLVFSARKSAPVKQQHWILIAAEWADVAVFHTRQLALSNSSPAYWLSVHVSESVKHHVTVNARRCVSVGVLQSMLSQLL